jgi:hypothetical protein
MQPTNPTLASFLATVFASKPTEKVVKQLLFSPVRESCG